MFIPSWCYTCMYYGGTYSLWTIIPQNFISPPPRSISNKLQPDWRKGTQANKFLPFLWENTWVLTILTKFYFLIMLKVYGYKLWIGVLVLSLGPNLVWSALKWWLLLRGDWEWGSIRVQKLSILFIDIRFDLQVSLVVELFLWLVFGFSLPGYHQRKLNPLILYSST